MEVAPLCATLCDPMDCVIPWTVWSHGLCDPMDCSLPWMYSSIHGIFQARVLQWLAISFSRGSSQPRDWTQVSNPGLPHCRQMTTLYARQQKRHRHALREQHWDMYVTICETDHQPKFDAWNRALKAGAPGQPMGWGGEGGRREVWNEGTHVHPCLIHVTVWRKPSQYRQVISLQLK